MESKSEASVIERCEALYLRYNRAAYVDPDPLSVVRRYEDPEEREIVALFSSSLALGRVDLILRAIEELLLRLPRPITAIRGISAADARALSEGFLYRFFRPEHVARLVYATGQILDRYGTLEAAFQGQAGENGLQVGLHGFVAELLEAAGGDTSILLSKPEKGSAAKRLHLFLRWMVRQDDVDPGGWTHFSPAELLIPVDTHMLRIARELGITKRKQADLRTSWEITEFFRTALPEDPVRYDFVLTRFGIRPGFRDEVVAEFGENPYTP